MKVKKERQYIGIDGNPVKYAEAYCLYRQGVLTKRNMKLHKCKEKKCKRCIYLDYIDVPISSPEKEKLNGDEYRKKVLGLQ